MLSIRDSWYQSRISKTIYCSDLRVAKSLSRRTQLQWWKCYADILENYRKIDEFAGVEVFHTAILDENKAAIRAFSNSKRSIVYRPLRKYKTISLIGRYPWACWLRHKSVKFKISKATETDRPQIVKFLSEANKMKEAGYCFSEKLEIKDFILAKDEAGQIVSCVSLYSSTEARRIIFEKVAWSIRFLGFMTKLLGGKLIREGQELKTLYLTNLEFVSKLSKSEQVDILASFIDLIYIEKMNRGFHSISYLNFAGNELESAAKKVGGVYVTIPGTLYEVLHRSQARELVNPEQQDYGFEISLA